MYVVKKQKYCDNETRQRGGGVVVMDRGKYFDKCLAMLNTEQSVLLWTDPTSSFERKVQHML